MFFITMTLEEAKRIFEDKLFEGTVCPCCERKAKAYKRKLNAGMAAMLVQIYALTEVKKPKNGWLHIANEFLKNKQNAVAQEYSKLRFWGLLEAKPNTDPEIPGSGYWRITQKGKNFVLRRLRVQRNALVYDNFLVGTVGREITIDQALGDRFVFAELMATNGRLVKRE